MKPIRIFAYLAGAAALAASFFVYMECIYRLGFPDGLITELGYARRRLAYVFIGVSVVLAACFIYLGAVAARKGGLPRIGTIKDYPATGLLVGCGNWYFHLPRYAASPEAYFSADHTLVFISNSDGDNAWINLGGRDVRLTKIKPSARARRKTRRPWYYRHGRLRVGVAFEEIKPGAEPAINEDYSHKIRITLREGRAVRTRRAVGYADC